MRTVSYRDSRIIIFGVIAWLTFIIQQCAYEEVWSMLATIPPAPDDCGSPEIVSWRVMALSGIGIAWPQLPAEAVTGATLSSEFKFTMFLGLGLDACRSAQLGRLFRRARLPRLHDLRSNRA